MNYVQTNSFIFAKLTEMGISLKFIKFVFIIKLY